MPAAPYVLYVHPYNHVVDELVPMGAVNLMNRVSAPKLGRYAYEVTPDDLAGAGCVALDLHWYFSIEAVGWIATDIKRVAPELPIILGGITASFYAEYLIEHFPVDYVIAGDAEHAFPRLVQALLAGETPPPLPNTWVKGRGEPTVRLVEPIEYDANDYLTLSWFPTLETHTHAMHAEYAKAPFWGRMDRYHPYVPLNRGCRFPCEGCFGSYQRDVFGPGQIDRSAESLARNLDAIEAHPHYRFLTLTGGTEDVGRFDAYREVFGRKRALGAYVMHFCDLPDDATLQMLLEGFDELCVDFTNPTDVPLPLRAKDISIADAEDRIFQIARMLDARPDCRMGISFTSTEPSPFKERLLAADFERVALKENSEWGLPRPNVMELPPAERPGLAQLREARRRGKRDQAEKFRGVSRGHANYVVARALCPALYPILDQSYLQWVDGTPRSVVEPEHPELQAFQQWYVQEFRRWFVTTLPDVAIDVSWVSVSAPLEEPALVSREAFELIGDAMPARLSQRYDGIAVEWEGRLPAFEVQGLVLRPRLGWGEGRWLDATAVGGLQLWVLPAKGATAGASVRLDVRLSQHTCRVRLESEAQLLSETRWSFAELLPDSTLLPAPAVAEASGFGPTDLLRNRFDDLRLPRMARKVIDRALARDALGFRWELIEESARWVCHRFSSGDVELHTFVMAPGSDRHYCQTRHFSLVYQEAGRGAADSPEARQLLERLARVLRLVDSSLSSASIYAR